jgi:hypothetical protein
MKWMIPAAIALGAFAAAFGSIWFFTYDGRPKCDSAEAVATIKHMALQKINGYDGDSFLRNVYDRKKIVGNTYPDDLTVDSFRKRGDVGTTGSICAAQIGIHVAGQNGRATEISVEYTIEPTTDGKTMVTARFQPTAELTKPK